MVTTRPPKTVGLDNKFDVQISAENASGNVDTSFNGPVTIALDNNPGGATLGGTVTVNAVNGLADFPDLTLNQAGSGYTLQAASAGLTSVDTGSFSVAYIVTNTSDYLTSDSQPAPGSLRDMITAVNADPIANGPDQITFASNISGATISLQSPLPALARDQVTITGPITLDGTSASGDGLDISGNQDSVQNVTFTGFSGNGVSVTGNDESVTGSQITGNQNGIVVSGFATGNTIGGTVAGAGNVITSNTNDGIDLDIVQQTVIEGNWIGTDFNSAVGLGNDNDGIEVSDGAAGNTIGGTVAGAGNVITSNTNDGIDLDNAQQTVIEGNCIGTNPSGDTGLGNGSDGIDVSGGAMANTIGGTASGAGNTIAYNDGNGVTIGNSLTDASTGDAILENAIYANAGLGIDLGDDGVTENDSEGHAGPNLFQDFPVLTYASSASGTTSITGSLSGAPNTTYRVEFFSDPTEDPSGYGQGQTFLGFANIATNSNGVASFPLDIATTALVGQFISATATDPAGDTSEFSADIFVADVALDSVSTTNSREAIVDYDINNPNLTQPFYIQIYRSDKPTYQSDDPNTVAVGERQEVTDLQPGQGETCIDLSQENSNWSPQTAAPGQDNLVEPLAPDPSLPYVLAVVVDAQGKVPTDLTVDDSQAHFKIWVIADVTQGFGSSDQSWVQQMASLLSGPPFPSQAGYNSAMPFYWNSFRPLPGQTVSGGNSLYEQILGQAAGLKPDLGENDVIDVQLIGHSRGSAVIGQAMQDLVSNLNTEEPALAEGYYKLTFLDPHPANLNTLTDISVGSLLAPPTDLAGLLLYAVFSAAYDDPRVVVNSRVNQVDDYYEQDSVSNINAPYKLVSSYENFFNLMGDPSQIEIQDSTSTVSLQYNLSSLGLGHSDVWQWYMDNVIKTLGTGAAPRFCASSGGTAPPPGNLNLLQILYPQFIVVEEEATALVSDLILAGTQLDQGSYTQSISDLESFDSAIQAAPVADFVVNSAPVLESIGGELIDDLDSTDIANINSSTALGPDATATVDADDPANNQQVSGSLTTGSQFSGTAQFSVGNYTQDPDADFSVQLSQATFDVQTTGIDASTDASASVTFTAQVPAQQLQQTSLAYFGDDGQWHTAAYYDGLEWVQVGPSGDTPIQEQDTPVSGTGKSTIRLSVEFDNNTTPAVGDLDGTVFALMVPAPISLSALPGGTVNAPYDQTITASGGTGNKTLVVSDIAGSIPGLPIPADGTNNLAIVGTPTAAGTVSFTVARTDGVGIPFSQIYTLTVSTADPSQSTISVTPANISAGQTTRVTLTAIDSSGAEETSGGLDVAFGLGSGSGTGTFSAVTDNGDGTYTAVFTGIIAGTNTITATINDQPVTTSAPAVAVTPGAVDLAESTVSAAATALPVGGNTTVTLTARDSYGNQETTGGLLVSFGLESAVGTFSQVTDNDDGTYSATFTAISPGTATFEATINYQSVSSVPAGITVVPLSLAQSSVTVAPATILIGGTATVTLTAIDADGTQETTGGFTVAFELGTGTGSGTFGPVTDNDNGTYTATFSARTIGSNTISATIDGFTVTTEASVTVTNPLTVTALGPIIPDPRNIPVSTIDVTFNEPINSGTSNLGAVTLTDADGPNLITSAVTIKLVGGPTCQINGLSTLTASNGNYTLTVNAAAIDDQNGNPGAGTLSTSWLMDTTPPTSTVNPLPQRGTSLTFTVSVTGSDGGSPPSGVKSYNIYSSTNGGAWSLWTTVPASNPTANYTGQSNTTYAFYSTSTDNAGNTQAYNPQIEANTYLPDLTPPVTMVDSTTGTNPSTVSTATGTFTLNLTGSDPGGGVLTYFEVYVSVDSAPYTPAAPPIPAGPADSSGYVHATIPYQALTDGTQHTYAFYSIGLDSAGNTQSAPTSPNLTLQETFATPAQLQTTSLIVEDGAVERSYIRYLQVDFNESDTQSGGELTQIVNSLKTASPEIQLYQYDLNDDASSKTPVSLSNVNVSVIDHAIDLDFGANGLGGSPNTTTADGYYELDINLPSGSTAVHHFYRLLGDVTGDGTVDNNDLNEIAAEINLSNPTGLAPLGADVTGEGTISALDLTLATRAKGHKLKSNLALG